MKKDFEKLEIKSTNDIAINYKETLQEVLNNKKLMSKLQLRGITADKIDGNLGKVLEFIESQNKRDQFYLEYPDGIFEETMIDIGLDEEDRVVRFFTSCPKFIERNRLVAKFIYKDFPTSWLDLDAKANEVDPQKTRAKLILALKAMQKGSNKWIYTYGSAGRGKTFLTVRSFLSIEKTSKEATFAVIDYPSFVSDITNDYYKNKDKIDKIISSLASVDYLAIRNFGDEENNDIVRNAVTIPLLTSRNSKNKPTVIISEFSLEEIKKINSPFNNVIKGNQIVRIIRDNIEEEIIIEGAKIY